MTKSNAMIVRKAYEDFAQGNVPAVFAVFDPSITWHVPGDPAQRTATYVDLFENHPERRMSLLGSKGDTLQGDQRRSALARRIQLVSATPSNLMRSGGAPW